MGGRVAAGVIVLAFVGYSVLGVVNPRRVSMAALRYHRDWQPSPAGLVMTRISCGVMAVASLVMGVVLLTR